jgi:hypothetical protein
MSSVSFIDLGWEVSGALRMGAWPATAWGTAASTSPAERIRPCRCGAASGKGAPPQRMQTTGAYEPLDERNLMSNKLDFSKELIGRRALVTGGTRGIGAAIVIDSAARDKPRAAPARRRREGRSDGALSR